MKINVSKRHIVSALGTNGKRSPIELAVMDLDCFEEIRLRHKDGYQYQLELVGETVVLPKKAQKALTNFFERGSMHAFSFELPLQSQMPFAEETLLFEAADDYFGFGMSY
jgi:hypothetical protein